MSCRDGVLRLSASVLLDLGEVASMSRWWESKLVGEVGLLGNSDVTSRCDFSKVTCLRGRSEGDIDRDVAMVTRRRRRRVEGDVAAVRVMVRGPRPSCGGRRCLLMLLFPRGGQLEAVRLVWN